MAEVSSHSKMAELPFTYPPNSNPDQAMPSSMFFHVYIQRNDEFGPEKTGRKHMIRHPSALSQISLHKSKLKRSRTGRGILLEVTTPQPIYAVAAI